MDSSNGGRVAARPIETITIHKTASAENTMNMASRSRQPLPRRMCARARETNAGAPLRRRNKSPVETGRVSRYSKSPNTASKHAAAPKLHRQLISASESAGRRKIVRKPSTVGDHADIRRIKDKSILQAWQRFAIQA